MTPTTYGSVCSGIEAASVAWHDLGWQAAWLAEIEPFPCAVLAHHYPGVPNLGDMTKIAQSVLSSEVPAPDVLVGGTPCQAFSVAGLRNSLADERGNLTLKYVELADAIDHVRRRAGQPEAVIVWENVPGVLSTSDNAFGCFLGALAGAGGELQPAGKRWTDAGCVYGPKRAVAWRILDAQYFGLAQRRRRVFVVASARNGFDPAEVLLERDGMRRDFAPRRETRESVASSLAASAGHHGHSSPRGDGSDNLIADTLRGHPRPGSNSLGAMTLDVAQTLLGGARKKGGISYDDAELLCVAHGQALADMGTDIAPTLSCNHESPYIAGTLQASGKAAGSATQQDAESGLLVPVAFDSRQDCCSSEHVFGALGSSSPQAQAVAFQTRGADRVDIQNECAYALLASGGNGGRRHEMNVGVPVAFAQNSRDELREMPYVGALAAEPGMKQTSYIRTAMQVRRLTPRECERLQGFPDDYTNIPWRTWQEAARKSASYEGLLQQRGMSLRGPSVEECPDGPRYRALGNSMAVKCMRWIGRRIKQRIEAAA